jgi:hypothetical protein
MMCLVVGSSCSSCSSSSSSSSSSRKIVGSVFVIVAL